MAEKVALIAGAGGIVGRALMEEIAGRADWRAIGLSRHAPDALPPGRHVRADLFEPASLEAIGGDLAEVTHVFFTAYSQRATGAEEDAPNLAMLQNLVEAVEPVARGLRHIQLIHGSKWYGSHYGPYPTPAREDQQRHPMGVFYYAQQDWLAARQAGRDWTWSTLRPHGIWGFALRSQLNMMQALAVYATVMKHMGQPLHYPGKASAFGAVYQCTEAAHLARAMLWAASEPRAANQPFNMTNGDFIRWKTAWPVLARWFGMEPGEVRTFDVAAFMADKEPMWAEIRALHGLAEHRISDLTTWNAAINYMFNAEWDQMSSLTKARQAGWDGFVDTWEMIPRQLGRLARDRIIPMPPGGG